MDDGHEYGRSAEGEAHAQEEAHAAEEGTGAQDDAEEDGREEAGGEEDEHAPVGRARQDAEVAVPESGASAAPRVVVVSTARDEHARAVLAHLSRRRVPAALLDTARFPERAALALRLGGGGWRGGLRQRRAGAVDASRIGAVWWRRPEPYEVAFRGPAADGAYCAADAAVRALLRGRDVLWVNDPDREEPADEKPGQLALAARLGLAVPDSLVTNDPAAARAFVRERAEGETVHKNVTSARALWRTTALARERDRALFASVRHLPLLFQERVPAAADVRVTVVGERLFAAEIDTPGRAPRVDHRSRIARARFRAVHLPRDVEAKVRRLVARLGLAYAAVDLVRRPDGEHVFLEVNPSGEWLFVERRTGQRITAAVADLVARGA
jgi:glutathione synthase/RimK-type ligase-like ATP-grasp enzyme